MDEIVHRVLRFDRFTLDLARGCVRSADRELELRPKAFKVLHHLVANAGRLVSKEELQTAVWGRIIVSDDSLVQSMRQLRRTLSDDEHRLIKTVARRGYLLDAQVFDHVSAQEPRLAAIVSGDVAGYSRLMGRDESGTLAALQALRRDIVDPRIGAYRGRIVKTTGDGLLVEFGSVVDAMRCVVDVQFAVAAHNEEIPAERRIEFRIGVNIGDIIIKGDDVIGDGVNVAARLQEVATPGGICVTARVQEDVADKLGLVFEDAGEQHLKNIARPIRIYGVRLGARVPVHDVTAGCLPADFMDPGRLTLKNIERPISAFHVQCNPVDRQVPSAAASRPLGKPERVHSILVTPFASATDDPSHQALAEAITDDLTHDLSRIPGTLVIAQGTARTLKGRFIDARTAAKEFAVRFVVDGSVRISSSRIRIQIQLVDADSGGQVWAERIEAPRTDLAELQENVSGRIAWALELELPTVEALRRSRSDDHPSDAFELSMLGWSLMNRAPSRENLLAAVAHFRKAYDLDPRLVATRIGLSFTYVRKVVSFWSDAPQQDLAQASDLIDPAIADAPKHDRGHFVKGLILRMQKQPEQAGAFFERAIQLNPNYAQAIAFLGHNQTIVGCPEQSFELIERAIRLSPSDPQLGVWLGFASIAHVQLQQYERAIEVSTRAVAANPEYGLAYLHLAMASALQGKGDKAKAALTNMIRLLPRLSISMLRARMESGNADYIAAWDRGLAALKGLGLPD